MDRAEGRILGGDTYVVTHPIDENPITHKALAKLHAKLDRIERKIDAMNHMVDCGIEPTAVRPKWMDGFVLEDVETALNGVDVKKVTNAFYCGKTDEGYEFWCDVDLDVRAGYPLSTDARAALTRMINEYKAAN